MQQIWNNAISKSHDMSCDLEGTSVRLEGSVVGAQ